MPFYALFFVASRNLPRLARLSTGKRRVSVLSPIRALSFFEKEEQILEFGGVLGVLVCASGFNPRLAKYEKRTHKVSFFHIWWSRRELNPCPKTIHYNLLRGQLLV